MVEADRAFFDSNVEPPASVTFPDGVGPRDVPLTGDEVSIGRRSESKGFFPDIDLSSPVDDPAVSHRHAVLRRQVDGSWAVIDEMSTNGTWLNAEDDAPRPRRASRPSTTATASCWAPSPASPSATTPRPAPTPAPTP